jgi:O-antigen/teichoic acid export membrane protein
LRRLIALIPTGRFARRLALLSGGTLLGQLLLVLVSPLLTRLYVPAEFGVLAVFMSLNGILGGIASLRYEHGVIAARDEADAVDMVWVTLIASFAYAAAAVLVVWLIGDAFTRWIDTPALAPMLWLLPPTLLAVAIGTILEHWSMRRGTYRINGAGRTAQFGSQALLQVAFGFAGLKAFGLLVGYALGYVLRFVLFLLVLPAGDRRELASCRVRRFWPLAREHWRHAVLGTPARLLQNAVQLLPAILLAALYDPATAGLFALAQRLLVMPVRLLSHAASQVFLGEAVTRDPQAVRRLFRRTTLRFLLLGSLGMAPILLAGPPLFALVFGEPWRIAGVMAQALVVSQLARFVVMPVSQTLSLYNRLDLELLTSVLMMLGLAAAFVAGAWLELTASMTVLLYSVLAAVTQLLAFLVSWLVLHQATKGTVDTTHARSNVIG